MIILNDFDKSMLSLALKQAEIAYRKGEVPVGAVIVNDDYIPVAFGYNRTITDHDPTAHAEIVAIRLLANKINNYRLNGMSMYVTLEPCVMCMGAILNSRLAKVIYGARDFKTGSCGGVLDIASIKEINHHTAVFDGSSLNDCSYIMKNFFYNLRRKKKN
ncbi:zinc-binding cytidine/deoxycytidylate deaminase [Candidatus Kinetoplastibacterium blastocrithidii TCC012E]|uniref:tRNA-specific adenosine deaminase n=1 Tax=Candidatus Kinetoplastidibacterium blastocrithidiae TCC012E TaxID=1208922 RepID=M1LVV8_9PROT|nr:tRNA adenosine(34) deaminase TadA [Candidatus Kinetoplastibacterium blastocrithidii]AFZ83574.1 zinc-binding protein hydrolase [Candidatus Kinetoplastibacterium blastocrithidii (ex Strigomonas culicis)]AGF49692.1 zinc-binding cytidine/deoxycytidylate deaminase [Candidatus Kinetoplastibacterium blastocrithidii TCC012E]